MAGSTASNDDGMVQVWVGEPVRPDGWTIPIAAFAGAGFMGAFPARRRRRRSEEPAESMAEDRASRVELE